MSPYDIISELRFMIRADLNLIGLDGLNVLYTELVDIQRELRKYVELVSKRRFDLMYKNN